MLKMYKTTWTVEDVDAKEFYELSIYHFGKTPTLRWYGIKDNYDPRHNWWYSSHIIEYSGTRPLWINEISSGFLKCLTNHWEMKFLSKKKDD